MGKLSEIGTGKKTLDQFAQALDDSRDYPTERFAHDAKKMLQDFIEISVTRGDYFVWDEAKALLRVLEILEARANG